MDELHAWLILARAPVHAGALQPILAQAGCATRFVAASSAELHSWNASAALIEFLRKAAFAPVESDLKWLQHKQHHFIHWSDHRYPSLLREIKDAPVGLYVCGTPECLQLPQLAIVGSRNPTPSGRDTAFEFARQLACCGLTITSGMAIGVDAACHRGALKAGGSTLAVCGTGLDIVYPRCHRELAEEISACGALVSEFPLGTPALKPNFPRRNRIISGLSLGTLVTEAAIRSGSLITARLAAEQGREVFAIPGSIHSPMARGCHHLIRSGAKLTETAQDILCELGPLAATLPREAQKHVPGRACNASPVLDKEYEILLDALGFEAATVDSLVEKCGLNSGAVASMLLILELDGHVESYPGGVYVRTRPEATK